MTSPVMTAEEAAWVREHAWLPPMRRTYAQWPHLYDRCPCHHFLAMTPAAPATSPATLTPRRCPSRATCSLS